MTRKPDIRATRTAVLAIAAALAFSPLAAEAQSRRDDRGRAERNFERRQPRENYQRAPQDRDYGPRGPARRGAFLPDDRRGAPVGDYNGARLRAPPQGYGWYRDSGRYMLLDKNTGQVLDVVE